MLRQRFYCKEWNSLVLWLLLTVILVADFMTSGATELPTTVQNFVTKVSRESAPTIQLFYEGRVATEASKVDKQSKTGNTRNNGSIITEVKVQDDNVGFAAEWRHEKTKSPERLSEFPSPRIGPGTWIDDFGNWWIFGGQQPINETYGSSQSSSHYLSDLWMFNSSTLAWNLISHKKERISNETLPSNPGNFDFPRIVGTPILCGNNSARKLAVYGKGRNNVYQIWLFDTNTTTWTSSSRLVENVTQENPDFTNDTLVWCSESGMMALKIKATSTNSENNSFNKLPNVIYNLWKLDMESGQWLKLSQVEWISTLGNIPKDPPNFARCRVVSTQGNIHRNESMYIICPSASSLELFVYFFDIDKKSVALVGSIFLKDEFTSKRILSLDKFILHAIVFPHKNLTILFLAYKNHIDLWIRDHCKGDMYPVKNVWNGERHRVFQSSAKFYQFSVSIENVAPVKSFFMINPRSKVLNFDKIEGMDFSGSHFKISVFPDKQVLIPRRDISMRFEQTLQRNRRDMSNPIAGTMSTVDDDKIEENQQIKSANTIVSNDVFLGGNAKGDATVTADNKDVMGHDSENRVHSVIFFIISLSLFACIGAIIFVRRCVQCPVFKERGEDTIVLDSEPPHTRYSGIPGDLPFHTPLL